MYITIRIIIIPAPLILDNTDLVQFKLIVTIVFIFPPPIPKNSKYF